MRASDEDLTRRALAAYYAAGRPGRPRGAVVEHDGKWYVVLRERGATRAVYRVRTDGVLKGLRRWPKHLD
jgi:hypothetical protein